MSDFLSNIGEWAANAPRLLRNRTALSLAALTVVGGLMSGCMPVVRASEETGTGDKDCRSLVVGPNGEAIMVAPMEGSPEQVIFDREARRIDECESQTTGPVR